MAQWKFSFGLNDVLRPCGYTESYFLSDQAADIKTALESARELAQARVMLLGRGVRLDGIRLTDITTGGGQLFDGIAALGVNEAPFYNKGLLETDLSDQPQVTARIKLATADGKHKSIHGLSGIPDSVTIDGKKKITDANWAEQFKKFTKVITNGSYAWRGVDNTNANPKLAIATISQQSPAVFDVPNYVPKVGDAIRVSTVKMKDGPRPSGILHVSVLGPGGNDFKTEYNNPTGTYLGNGFVRVQKYTLYTISTCAQYAIGSHRRGRVLFGDVGRKRRKN